MYFENIDGNAIDGKTTQGAGNGSDGAGDADEMDGITEAADDDSAAAAVNVCVFAVTAATVVSMFKLYA